ncbi:MAG: hypothetical protein RDV48_18450 [Candidatus Eremiobacteraeota bacterium]|nr:hypothetical protein [Candidatus Eremiobacteraeota bacterium]
MKKKVRAYKKSPSSPEKTGEAPLSSLRAFSEPKESVPGENPEKAPPAPPSSPGTPALSGKKEMVMGFGILGVVVGFLAGYGNLDMAMGLMGGMAGLVAGAFCGWLPYMPLPKP